MLPGTPLSTQRSTKPCQRPFCFGHDRQLIRCPTHASRRRCCLQRLQRLLEWVRPRGRTQPAASCAGSEQCPSDIVAPSRDAAQNHRQLARSLKRHPAGSPGPVSVAAALLVIQWSSGASVMRQVASLLGLAASLSQRAYPRPVYRGSTRGGAPGAPQLPRRCCTTLEARH